MLGMMPLSQSSFPGARLRYWVDHIGVGPATGVNAARAGDGAKGTV
jgi:hypothetical protein